MRERSNGPVFLIVLILSIVLMVIGIMAIAKKDTDDVKRVQQEIQTGDQRAEEIADTIQDVNANIEADYNQLDEGLDGVL